MYKYILFDADNTLLDFDKAEEVSIFVTLEHFGIDRVYSKRFSEINSSLWKLFEVNGIKRDEIKTKRFKILLDEIRKTDVSPYDMSEYYLDRLSMCSYTYEDAPFVCSKLREIGKKLFIITNGHTKTQTNRIKGCNIEKYIEKSYISEQIGYQKPCLEYFDFVLNEIKADKSECLIIGESISSDIKGGVVASIDTCWYNPKSKINTSDIAPTYTVNTLKEILNIFKE